MSDRSDDHGFVNPFQNPFDTPAASGPAQRPTDPAPRVSSPFAAPASAAPAVPAGPDPVIEKFHSRFNDLVPRETVETAPFEAPAERSSKSPKSRLLALPLGFFLGFLGAHNFYLGYKVQATIQLALFLIFFIIPASDLTSFVFLVLFIWIIADLFRIVFSAGKFSDDGKGRALAWLPSS